MNSRRAKRSGRAGRSCASRGLIGASSRSAAPRSGKASTTASTRAIRSSEAPARLWLSSRIPLATVFPAVMQRAPARLRCALLTSAPGHRCASPRSATRAYGSVLGPRSRVRLQPSPEASFGITGTKYRHLSRARCAGRYRPRRSPEQHDLLPAIEQPLRVARRGLGPDRRGLPSPEQVGNVRRQREASRAVRRARPIVSSATSATMAACAPLSPPCWALHA